MSVRIEQSWKDALQDEFDKPYFHDLSARLHAEKAAGRVIYPPGSQIFRAFDLCPLDKVKVVILGQDPYHRPGQAMGLLAGSLLGGLGMLAVLGLCRLVSRGGVGMGDVKLLSAMGLLLGLYGSMCVLLYAQLAALVWAVVLLVRRKASWKDTLPFAPFFTAGFLLCLILGTY